MVKSFFLGDKLSKKENWNWKPYKQQNLVVLVPLFWALYIWISKHTDSGLTRWLRWLVTWFISGNDTYWHVLWLFKEVVFLFLLVPIAILTSSSSLAHNRRTPVAKIPQWCGKSSSNRPFVVPSTSKNNFAFASVHCSVIFVKAAFEIHKRCSHDHRFDPMAVNVL